MASQLLLVNPRKRAKTTPKRKAVARASKVVAAAKPRSRSTTVTVKANPIAVRRRRKRNPSARMTMNSLVKGAVMPALVSSAGALGLDVLMGYANRALPANLQMGIGATAVKFAGAVALGMVGEKIKGRDFGQQIMVGGMTVTLHELMKSTVAANMPEVPLAGMGVYNMNGMGVYNMNGGLKSPNGIPYADLGYYSPATVAGLGAPHTVGIDSFYQEYDENGELMAL